MPVERDHPATTHRPPRPAGRHERGALGTLADEMAARQASRASYPELDALQEFRELWSQLRTSRQVRQSLAQVPDDAGPLNSGRLVHRALILMRDLSPAYLQHFLAHADTLSWLETLQEAGVLAGNEPAPSAGARPRARRAQPKPRPRKG